MTEALEQASDDVVADAVTMLDDAIAMVDALEDEFVDEPDVDVDVADAIAAIDGIDRSVLALEVLPIRSGWVYRIVTTKGTKRGTEPTAEAALEAARGVLRTA